MSSIIHIGARRTPHSLSLKPSQRWWVRRDTQATKEMRLWYPQPTPKECRDKPEAIAKRVEGLLECGYKIDELEAWFRLKGNRCGTNTVKANQIWGDIKAVYQNRCAYCGLKTSDLTKDHVDPVSKGGRDTMDNIVPACPTCNSSKRAKDLLDWPRFRKLQLRLLGFDVS